MTVLDASAVLALLQDEPGAQVVEDALAGSVLSTVNLAEVVGTLVDAGLPAPSLPAELATAGVRLVELSRDDAVLARRSSGDRRRPRTVARRPLLPRAVAAS